MNIEFAYVPSNLSWLGRDFIPYSDNVYNNNAEGNREFFTAYTNEIYNSAGSPGFLIPLRPPSRDASEDNPYDIEILPDLTLRSFEPVSRSVVNNNDTRKASVSDLPTIYCDDTCSICLEPMESGKEMRCKHVFHESCLDRWLVRRGTCPVCRS